MPGIRRVIGNQDDRIGAVYVNVFDSEDEDEQPIRYCESCAKNGFSRILKQRLYLDDKGKLLEPEPDADQFLQCWTCGDIVKVAETKIEGEVSDVVESEDDSNTTTDEVQVLFNRNSKTRKGRLQQLQERNTRDRINDPDALKAIRQGKRIENYSESIVE